VRLVDVADTDATLAATGGASLLWAESPTNPLLAIADIMALAEGAHALGVPLAVDNTFATPLLQRPLDLGADLVVHSVTKFLSGHADVLLGAAVTRDEARLAGLRERRHLAGAIPGPMEAYLALRGIRSLPVRMDRAQANAGELALRLSNHPAVARVRYPGLPSDPGHARAAKQMRGFGAMLSVELAGGHAAADGLCGRVRLLTSATSLGGIETTLERRHRWPGEEDVPPSLVRISVGCEHVEDLWADLDRALAA
jgi:cystathionine gamma-synthase